MSLSSPIPLFPLLHKPSSNPQGRNRRRVADLSQFPPAAFPQGQQRRGGVAPARTHAAGFARSAAKRRRLYGTLRQAKPASARVMGSGGQVGRAGPGWTRGGLGAAGARRLVRSEPPEWLLGKDEASGFGVPVVGPVREGALLLLTRDGVAGGGWEGPPGLAPRLPACTVPFPPFCSVVQPPASLVGGPLGTPAGRGIWSPSGAAIPRDLLGSPQGA